MYARPRWSTQTKDKRVLQIQKFHLHISPTGKDHTIFVFISKRNFPSSLLFFSYVLFFFSEQTWSLLSIFIPRHICEICFLTAKRETVNLVNIAKPTSCFAREPHYQILILPRSEITCHVIFDVRIFQYKTPPTTSGKSRKKVKGGLKVHS